MMEPMICETFLQFRYLSDLGLSPDGRYTAYIRQQANLASNGYDARLWVYDHSTGADRPLSSLSPVRAFSWMDNRTILFSGMRGTAGSASQDTTTYYALPVDGGEAQPLFTVPMRAGRARRLTDGRFVFTATVDMNRPNLDSLSPLEESSALEEYKNRTYDVLEDIPFWTNGLGLTSGQRSQLYIHDPASGVTTPLTAPPFKVTGFTVEGGRILYTGHRFTDVQTLRHGVFIWDAASGETRCLLEQDRYLVKLFALWRDQAVLCLTDGLGYGNGENGDFYTIPLSGGEPELLLRHSHHCVGNTVATDSRLGAGETWRVCGDTLYFLSTVDRDSRIEALDLTSGEARPLTGPGSVEYLDAAADRLVYLAFRENRIGEIYTLEHGREIRLTHANDGIYDRCAVSTPQPLEVDTGGPLPVQGWVLPPVAYVPGKKYPAILTIHGGPRLSYGSVFFHEMQVLAGAGYFVLFCNPRGSEGRGNDFADIRGRFGTIDYQDIMAFLDGALARWPDIDPTRLGVGGGSYGGFMTNWIIGHTDRFQAACSQRSIANWTGMEGTADIGYYFAKGQTGASHREDRDLQWQQSPLRYADHVTTPTLFLHGEEDYRCWKLEAIQMFTALQLRGVPSRLCLFPGENHELSRSGRPRQRLRRLEEMLRWYQRYLNKQEA